MKSNINDIVAAPSDNIRRLPPTVTLTTILSVLLVSAACGDTTQIATVETPDAASQSIAWDPNTDNPASLDELASFNYTLSELPQSGAAAVTPWAGSYWPTYRDSINFRWDGSSGSTPGENPSPAEKFATAFNRPKLVDNISKAYGIESRSGSCTETSECNADKGEVCSKRLGENEGRCIETWFGICHAWAPAAILVPEPKNPVTYNNVTFKVNDIKALVSLSYTDQVTLVSKTILSGRCNDSAEDLEFDDYGRPTNPACRNTNPGTFHVVAANLLGLQGRSFVEDKTFDYQVWNQPVRSYEVLQNTSVSAEQANQLLEASGSSYIFNTDSQAYAHIRTRLSYIAEPAQNVSGNLSAVIDRYTQSDVYEYILELDGDGKIIGGEWIGASRRNHPDFLWLPKFKSWTEIAKDGGAYGTGIAWHEVKFLVEESVKEAGTPSGGFDWGSACEGGSGEFQQPIAYRAIREVGEIPPNKADVRIALESTEDVDIQLVDKSTGTQIIAWPAGMLNGPSEACTTYESVEYCYSGYNGDCGLNANGTGGCSYGKEWIEVRGVTNRQLVMKAYGYKAGDAKVTYRWKAPTNCVDTGSGSFTQPVVQSDVLPVGQIKEGKKDIRIQLQAANDLDIQLYDGPIALIKWPDGTLAGPGKQTLDYKGMTLEWSGYNGVGGLGNEYITIRGEVPAELTMRVFGYRAGNAEVRYSWGLAAEAIDDSLF